MKKVVATMAVITALLVLWAVASFAVTATRDRAFNHGVHLNCGGYWQHCDRDHTGTWFYCDACGHQKNFR